MSNAVVVKNKIQMEGKEKISEDLQADIKYLLIKHIYQCGRERKVKNFDKEFKIADRINSIGDSVQEYNKFYRYLEEIVAYMKYYENK